MIHVILNLHCMFADYEVLIVKLLTGSFQQFDKEGSGEAEMNVTEVSSV